MVTGGQQQRVILYTQVISHVTQEPVANALCAEID